ncbi:MAG TPA: cytochrome c [Burkholderiales bacterium]
MIRDRRLAVLLALVAPLACANDIVRGGELYRQHCASCHGMQGMSTWPGAPSFARREAMLQPDGTLVDRIRAGRNAMPAYRGILTDRDILSIVTYTRTLMR